MRKRIGSEIETIMFDDSRLTYYYRPWENSMTGDGPIVKTSAYNDYVDIWYLTFERLEWYAEKSPDSGIVGFKIWGKDWEQQEMLDLYSPTKESKIELIKAWDFPLDSYTITLLNIGEKHSDSLGNYISHSHFKIQ